MSMRQFAIRLATPCVLLLLFPVIPIQAATWHVAVDGPENGDGTSWATAFNTIQAGIDAASDGDEVVLGDGTYRGEGNRDLSFEGKGITVRSLNGPQRCLINCEGYHEDHHIGFAFHSDEGEDSVLQGVTIFNGYSLNGGGLYMDEASPVITHCVITDNSASSSGGGIFCRYSSPTIVNTIISYNRSNTGGGLTFYQCSGLLLSNCTITENHGDWRDSAICFMDQNQPIQVANTIIWNNHGEEAHCIGVTIPSLLSIQYSLIEGGWEGEGNIDQDPLFAFNGSDLHLLPGSPCTNAGSNGLVPDGELTDLDGQPRISEDIVDMGAYELNPGLPPAIAISSSSITIIDPYGPLPANCPTIELRNRTSGTVSWTAETDVEWLTLTPSAGESNGEINSIEVACDPEGLSAGYHSAEITILDASNSAPLARIQANYTIGKEILVEANGSGEYPSIQAAINAAVHGDQITCGPGSYTGDGNHDIRLLGKAIMLVGRDGPKKTIIQCESEIEMNGFNICDGETPATLISGFTVTGARHPRGGITCFKASPSITNCIIRENQSRPGASRPGTNPGGGINLQYSSSLIEHTIIQNNRSHDHGHNIGSRYNSSPTISHCAILSDQYNDIPSSVSTDVTSTLTINNSIVWGTDTQLSPIYCYDVEDVMISGSCILGGWQGEGNINEYPEFARYPHESDDDEGEYDLRLRRTSPCIDTGITELVPLDLFDLDQDGDTSEYTPFDMWMRDRIVGSSVDIGPFEFGHPASIEASKNAITIYVNTSVGQGSTTVTIQNTGDLVADWSVHTLSSWLSVTPTRGKLMYDPQEITLTANAVNRPEGEYHATITFTSRRAANTPLTIPVCINVSSVQYRVKADGSGDYPTIQAAIDAAENGMVICCEDGIYRGEGNRDISFLGKQITLYSENGPENCIIDCEGSEYDLHRGFIFDQMEDENSVLTGFTICNGYVFSYDGNPSTNYGGAIQCISASPQIQNCIFRNNSATFGGAIYNSESSPSIWDCVFEGNAGQGTVIVNSNSSSSVIGNCHFHDNRSQGYFSAAGTISNWSGSFTAISNCIFESNYACEGASGVGDREAGSSISNCVFRANLSHCLYSEDSNTTVTNCLFYANEGYQTSCVSVRDSTTDFDNCTFAYNGQLFDYYTGSTVEISFSGTGYLPPAFTNCIFSNNSYLSGAPDIKWFGTPPEIRYSIIAGWVGEGNIDADPLFVQNPDDGGDGWRDDPDTDIDESANNDYGDLRLQAGSPCIDAGNNMAFTADLDTDLDGLPRFVDDPATDDTGLGNPPLIDMGPYEYQPSPESFLQTGLLHQGQATSISLNRSATAVQAGKTKRTKR